MTDTIENTPGVRDAIRTRLESLKNERTRFINTDHHQARQELDLASRQLGRAIAGWERAEAKRRYMTTRIMDLEDASTGKTI